MQNIEIMITLALLSLIAMILLSLVYLQTVICFTYNSPLPGNLLTSRQLLKREKFIQPNYVLKGQRREKSFALGVGFGGGGMMKKTSGGFGGGGGGLGSNSMGKSSFG